MDTAAHAQRLVAMRAEFLRMRVQDFRVLVQNDGGDCRYHANELAAAAESLLAAIERAP